MDAILHSHYKVLEYYKNGTEYVKLKRRENLHTENDLYQSSD